jgi:hypothetical protein
MTDDDDSNRTPDMLSPVGRRRREAILYVALQAAGKRRFHRRAVHAAAGCGVTALLAMVTLMLLPHRGTGPASPHVVEAPPPAPARITPAVTASPSLPLPDRVHVVRPHRVEVTIAPIRTDPTLVDQWAVPRITASGGVQRVDDVALMKALGSAGLSGGVVVRQGRPELWWQPTVLRDSRAAKGGGI